MEVFDKLTCWKNKIHNLKKRAIEAIFARFWLESSEIKFKFIDWIEDGRTIPFMNLWVLNILGGGPPKRW